jgi:hypothetical protein
LQKATGKFFLNEVDKLKANIKELADLKKNADEEALIPDKEEVTINWQTKIFSKVLFSIYKLVNDGLFSFSKIKIVFLRESL